ncbi:MAG: hypothetical protein HPY45_17325 [Anaerolineae bacterium]|nr:hypothetical protein [Anaerolineae bacterium]
MRIETGGRGAGKAALPLDVMIPCYGAGSRARGCGHLRRDGYNESKRVCCFPPPGG